MRVKLRGSVEGKILAHVFMDPEMEVMGTLYGTRTNDLLEIIESLSPEQLESRPNKCEPNYVDMTKKLDELNRNYNGNLLPLGWYHNHPGHGLFMSQDDIKVHETYPPNTVAMVIDTKFTGSPIYKFFTIENGTVKKIPYEIDYLW